MTTWRDQVALVTGGARGIGRATARLLAKRGAAVCVNYAAHAEAAEGLAAEIIAAGGRAIAAMADVAETAAVEAMVARAEKELGPVTILVNNAGVSWPGTIDTYDPEQVTRMRRVNVEGLIHATRAVIGGMQARRYGRIVNVSSIAALGTALPGHHVLCSDQGRGCDFDQTLCHGAWLPQHHCERGGAWLCPNRHDAWRSRCKRLAGDRGAFCCTRNDRSHRRTRGHRQCGRVLGLTEVRLDHGTGVDGGWRTNGLHRTWVG